MNYIIHVALHTTGIEAQNSVVYACLIRSMNDYLIWKSVKQGLHLLGISVLYISAALVKRKLRFACVRSNVDQDTYEYTYHMYVV